MITELKEGFEKLGGGVEKGGANLEKEVGYWVMKMWG